MNESEIRQLLSQGLGECELQMQIEGNKIMLVMVAESFDGLNRVKRQQKVYQLLNDKISSGEIHAVTMRCLTPAEANNAS